MLRKFCHFEQSEKSSEAKSDLVERMYGANAPRSLTSPRSAGFVRDDMCKVSKCNYE